MRKYYFLILVFLFGCQVSKWPTSDFIKKKNYKEVAGTTNMTFPDFPGCEHIDRQPMYPNGIKGIYKHLRTNIQLPEASFWKKNSGKVIVSFVVDKDGYIEDIQIVQGVDPLLNKEAIRVIKLMDRWIPGVCNGEFVNVQFNFPIKFSLE